MKRIKLFRTLLEETADLTSLDEVCQVVLRILAPQAGFLMAMISLYDPVRDILVEKARHGLPLRSKPMEIPGSQLWSGPFTTRREALVLRNLDKQSDPKFDFLKNLGIKTYVSIPIVFHKKALGVLGFANREQGETEELDFAWHEDVTAFVSCLIAQKEANEELRNAQQRLNEAQKLAGVGSWERNVRTNASSWSLETYRLLGLDPTLPASFPTFLSRVHSEDLEALKQSLTDSVAGRAPYDIVFRVNSLNGVEKILNSKAELRRDPSGAPLALLGTLQDVTEQKLIEREKTLLLEKEQIARATAERSNHEKDFFLATLSHELRTPLTAIMTWSELLADKKMDAKTFDKGILLVQKSARAQARLIEDLLDVSRIISGKITLELCTVPLDALLETLTETFVPQMKTKNIGWQCRLEVIGLRVFADPIRLQQVLSNLVSNALKFTPAEGTIALFARASGSSIEISIRDSGEGIPPEFLPVIFNRFTQADTSYTKKHGGLGLGLAISQGLIEMMGGVIRAESPGLGKGATFVITLPKANEGEKL